jgi:hypothetical protein
MGEMKKVGRWFGSATRAWRRAADGGAAARPEGRWCRWESYWAERPSGAGQFQWE